jgi:hypothetical protein
MPSKPNGVWIDTSFVLIDGNQWGRWLARRLADINRVAASELLR